MDLESILEELKYDKRLIEWNLRRGIITHEDVKKHLSSLQDISSEAISFNLEDDDSEDMDESGNGSMDLN